VRAFVLAIFVCSFARLANAQSPTAATTTAPQPPAETPALGFEDSLDPTPDPPPPPMDEPAPLSEGERIAALELAIADDEKQLVKLRGDLEKREAEYEAALKELNALRAQLEVERAAHAQLQQTSDDQEAIERSQQALNMLEQKHTLAKERVELIVAERKAVQSTINNLTEKAALDAAALRELKGETAPSESPSAPSETSPPPAETPPAPGPESMLPGTGGEAKPVETKADPISQRVAAAESEALEKQAAAEKAKRGVEDIGRRRKTLEESIALERTRLSTAYKRHDNHLQTLQALESEFYDNLRSGQEYADLEEDSKKLEDLRAQVQEASEVIQGHYERLQVLQMQFQDLQQEELALAREAADKEASAAEARLKSWRITITDYAVIVLPQVGIVLLVLFALHWLLRMSSKRMVDFFARTGRGTQVERENHAKTLVSVAENAGYTAIYVGGALVVANVLRIPVTPLMGGVAVVGLAVAFGAQNLIRDYFYGFMILAENQYKIGDVVTIGTMTGEVERITLRITVLRDFEGKVYFIPNGQINSVINLTHEWSRVVLDIGVAYKEKVDRVMGVLHELAAEFCSDPAFADSILQEPELLGVQSLGDSSVVIRLCLVTRPDRKWPVYREMLRRIKNRFDAMGIEIPFPQRVVHHVVEGEGEIVPVNGVVRQPAAPASTN
jgi:small conductance mechanosensitive channel